jgi:hypothetical protein
MDTKDFEVLTPVRDKCMEAAHYWAVAGKEAADNLGDPLYQYLFHMIVAYWLPRSTCKTTCTAGEIREKIRHANMTFVTSANHTCRRVSFSKENNMKGLAKQL